MRPPPHFTHLLPSFFFPSNVLPLCLLIPPVQFLPSNSIVIVIIVVITVADISEMFNHRYDMMRMIMIMILSFICWLVPPFYSALLCTAFVFFRAEQDPLLLLLCRAVDDLRCWLLLLKYLYTHIIRYPKCLLNYCLAFFFVSYYLTCRSYCWLSHYTLV
jgi:hypothetical protein